MKRKLSMNEETFDRLRKLISEGDEMDAALGYSNGKSFEAIANDKYVNGYYVTSNAQGNPMG